LQENTWKYEVNEKKKYPLSDYQFGHLTWLVSDFTAPKVKTPVLPDDYWTEEQFKDKKIKQLEKEAMKTEFKSLDKFQIAFAAMKEAVVFYKSAEVASGELHLFQRMTDQVEVKSKKEEEIRKKEEEETKKKLEETLKLATEMQAQLDSLKSLRKGKGKRKAERQAPYSKRPKVSPKEKETQEETRMGKEEEADLAARLEKLKNPSA